MIAVDTNVLLRALVDDKDAPNQCAAAQTLIAGAGKVRVAGIVFMDGGKSRTGTHSTMSYSTTDQGSQS